MATVIECFKVRWKRQFQAKLVTMSVMLDCMPIWTMFGLSYGRYFLILIAVITNFTARKWHRHIYCEAVLERITFIEKIMI